jgi:hypothetical protein
LGNKGGGKGISNRLDIATYSSKRYKLRHLVSGSEYGNVYLYCGKWPEPNVLDGEFSAGRFCKSCMRALGIQMRGHHIDCVRIGFSQINVARRVSLEEMLK